MSASRDRRMHTLLAKYGKKPDTYVHPVSLRENFLQFKKWAKWSNKRGRYFGFYHIEKTRIRIVDNRFVTEWK